MRLDTHETTCSSKNLRQLENTERLKTAQLCLVSAGRLKLGPLSSVWDYGKSVLKHIIWDQKWSIANALSHKTQRRLLFTLKELFVKWGIQYTYLLGRKTPTSGHERSVHCRPRVLTPWATLQPGTFATAQCGIKDTVTEAAAAFLSRQHC